MAKQRTKYLHISYIVKDVEDIFNYGMKFKSCTLRIGNNVDYNILLDELKKNYCSEYGGDWQKMQCSIISLTELSKETFDMLGGRYKEDE